MASWKQNKVVGIVAAVVFVLAVVVMVIMLRPKVTPVETEGLLQTPETTPNIPNID